MYRISVLIAAALLPFLLTISLVASGDDAHGYSFSLNGKTIEPIHSSLRSLGIDRDGVLVHLDDLVLLIDKEGPHSFQGDLDTHGRLYEFIDGRKQLIGIKTEWSYEKDAKVSLNPFAGLTPEDMKHIRGVYLNDAVSSEVLALLQHVVPEIVFVVVTHETATGDDRAFPPIPDSIQYLTLDERSSDGIKNYAPLQSFKSLVYLRVHALHGPGMDASLISANSQLAYLDLSGQTIRQTQLLGNLTGLRHLDLEHCDGLNDLSFLGSLAKLQRLVINDTQVTDLTPLRHLKNLEYVNANNTGLTQIPDATITSLTSLKVMGTPLREEMIAKFRKANPNCEVSYDWNETFQSAVEGVDRIRVRSGGTCGGEPENERTLLEITDAAQVARTIALVEVDPSDSGFHCMCCGEPSFEFYKGDALTATLGFHHGRSFRWSGGEWPGDGLLTNDSADSLCGLLAEHGVKGPMTERIETKIRDDAAARKWSLYAELLPREVTNRLMNAESEEEAVNAFIQGEQDKAERVKISLRIIGCDHGSWNQINDLDSVVLALLDNQIPSKFPGIGREVEIGAKDELIGTGDIIAAVKANENDAMLVRGGARWFFGGDKYTGIPDDQMEELLPLLAEHGLTSPRQINRRRTLLALKEIDNETAVTLLHGVLSGKYRIVTLTDAEAVEPGGMVLFLPGDSEVDEACSDQAYAALLLAELGRSEALETIRRLLASEKRSESKKVLKQAVRLLK